MLSKIKIYCSWLLFTLGVLLILINTYGLFKDIRPVSIKDEHLRFNNDNSLTYSQAINALEWGGDESAAKYANRATETISDALAHIQWDEYDNRLYNQLIPIWENYFLYFMGVFSGIPEFERYHFTDYKKSLYRGIGICGDASIVLSEVLAKNELDNRIITFPGHVIVEADIEGKVQTYDPDFGVSIPHSVEEIKQSPSLVVNYYKEKGYSKKEIGNLEKKYAQSYQIWDGVKHFFTKKYYFEKLVYWLKWPLPIFLIIVGMLGLWRRQG